MQFDLTRLPSLPHLPALSPDQKRSLVRLRIITYSILAIIALWLLLWSRAQSNKELQQSQQDQEAFRAQTTSTFDAYLKTQPTSATILTEKGLAIVGQNPELGSVWLRSAAEHDPKYRDGVLGAGFAELTLAGSLWKSNPQLAQEHTQIAQAYLEAAQTIDPIYAYTYELLAVAYTNLGDTEQAAVATKKAAAFAVSS